ncbi:RCC1 domain-containing protein, partial [Legionella waltersii]
LGLGHKNNQSSLQHLEIPKEISSLEGVVTDYYHTIVFGCDSKGRLLIFACGNNSRGQLGLGHQNHQSCLQPVNLPKDLNSLEGVVAGGLHTLVFGRDSNKKPLLFACGLNNYGQLGLGDNYNQNSLQPVRLPEDLNLLEGVVAGAGHTLVFGRDSNKKPLLFACGDNNYGQLGLGDNYNQNSLQPVRLPEDLNLLEGVVAGAGHTLVFGRDSNKKPLLFACGMNNYGQLGLGDQADQSSLQRLEIPKEISSLEGVVAGFNHTLVFGRDSLGKPLLFACGNNEYGQLGLGHQNNQSSLQRLELPQDLNSLEGVVAGAFHTLVFGCDSKGKPTLFAFGSNYGGQLGLGHQENQNLPTAVPKPVICDSEKYRLKMAIEHHIKTLSNEFSWFGLKKSPQDKIKILKQLCENLEQVDNANSKQKLREVMSTLLEEHKQTIKEHRNSMRKWCFFSPESPTHTETFLTEKMNSLKI